MTGPKFNMGFSLGNAIQLGAMLVAMTGFFFAMKHQADSNAAGVVENKAQIAAIEARVRSQENGAARLDERLRSMEGVLLRIDRRLESMEREDRNR